MTSTLDVFGPIVGPYTIEQAVVTHLQTWLWPTYLEATETLNGITVGTVEPPDPAAVYGVFDEQDFIATRMPGVMVSCVNPAGEPEHLTDGYHQQYELQVWSPVRNDDPSTARRDAGLYSQAVMAAMVEQFPGAYPDLCQDLWMTAAPSVLLPEPSIRTIYLGHVAFSVFVSPIVSDSLGPPHPLGPGQSPAPLGVVDEINITVTAEPLGS